MGRSRLDARLDAISALRDAPEGEAVAALARALADATPVVVARAAKLAASRGLTVLLPELEAALARFLAATPEADRGCLAKPLLMDACDELGSRDEALCLRAVRCRHPEPAYGGTVDRAAGVRVRALFALFRLRHPAAMREAARLLADQDPDARAGAATAVANGSPLAGVPLLVHHVLSGEAEERVLEAALDALLVLEPDSSVELLSELISSAREPVADLAAAARGASRLPAALPVLRAFAEAVPDRRARVAFGALAMARSEEATAFLLDVVRNGSTGRALAAVEALQPFAYDPELASRMTLAASGRKSVAAAVARATSRGAGTDET